MMKLILTCCTFLFFCAAFGQIRSTEETEKVAIKKNRMAIKGGVNMGTARVYQNDEKLDSKFVAGYGIGLLFKIQFEGQLYFLPNLAYNRRGYAYTPAGGSITEYKNTIHYFDMQPNLGVVIPSGKNLFIIAAGPHLSLAIAGTEKTTIANTTTSSPMKFSLNNNYGFIDLGVGTNIAYHMDHFLVEASFQLGLANINNNVETDFRNIRNRMLSLQVGYFLK